MAEWDPLDPFLEWVALRRGTANYRGLITYRYGKLTILNPHGLVDGACECYELMESQFEKIFDQPWSDITQSREDRLERR